jgi:hypothetical protein
MGERGEESATEVERRRQKAKRGSARSESLRTASIRQELFN